MNTILDVEMTFELRSRRRTHVSHAPVVRVRTGELDTWLVVDTGTTDTVLTRDLARRLGLRLELDEPGRDHAGGSVETHRMRGDLVVGFGDDAVSLSSPLVIPGPPFFTRWDIGGILCPQALHPGATVVLDFVAMRLRLVEGTGQEIDTRVRARHPRLERTALERVEATGEEAGLIVVAGRVAGESIGLMVNTGTDRCELSPEVVPGTVDAVLMGHGVGGDGVYGAHHDGAVLELGGRSIEAGAAIVRDQGESFQGQLGMGLLGDTVLVVPADAARDVEWWRRG